MQVSESGELLIVVAGRLGCALPLHHVGETMRALPIEAISGMPSYLLGLSIIRGVPTPVVELGKLLGSGGDDKPTRFVTLRLGERKVALAVDAVRGVRRLSAAELAPLPPLLQSDAVQQIGTLDAQLLVVLAEGWSLPDEVWATVG